MDAPFQPKTVVVANFDLPPHVLRGDRFMVEENVNSSSKLRNTKTGETFYIGFHVLAKFSRTMVGVDAATASK